MWDVYEIVFQNSKRYIGVTSVGIKCRFEQHIKASYKGDSTLYAAIRKYGIENIKISVLDRCLSEKEAKQREVELIAKMNTLRPNGYNSTIGGNGVIDPSGISERIRIERIKLTKATEAYKQKQRDVQQVVWNDEMKKMRSEQLCIMWKDPIYRERMKQAHTKPDAKCHHKKLLTHEEKSAIYVKLWENPKHREKVITAQKIGMANPVHRNQISLTMKQLMSDSEYRKKHADRMKIVMNRPEVRKRCSIAHGGVV